MSEIIVALISVSGAFLVSLVGVFVAKKYNIGPNQDKLVQTLKDLLEAQDRKIEELQRIVANDSLQISELTKKVAELQALTIHQALLIDEGLPRRARVREEG